MIVKAPYMNEKLDRSTYKYNTTAIAGPYIRLTPNSPVSYAYDLPVCRLCKGNNCAAMSCNNVDLLAPDYRSTIPLQLVDTCDPTATVRDCLARIYDNIRAIALAQNGVVHFKDTNCEDAVLRFLFVKMPTNGSA